MLRSRSKRKRRPATKSLGKGTIARQVASTGLRCRVRKGVDMADKSPRKVASKKSGKTLKEKRQAKKDKVQTRKGLTQGS